MSKHDDMDWTEEVSVYIYAHNVFSPILYDVVAFVGVPIHAILL